MKLDLLIFQLAVLFLPGLLWARLDARFALSSKPTDTEFFLRAFQFGLVSYGVTFLPYSALGWPFTLVDLADAKDGLSSPQPSSTKFSGHSASDWAVDRMDLCCDI